MVSRSCPLRFLAPEGKITVFIRPGSPPRRGELARVARAGLGITYGEARPSPGAGPRRRWTDDRIRSELVAFANELGRWPSHRDFVKAGRTPLYVAASKAGGVGRWVAELGMTRTEKLEKPGRPT